MNITKKVLVGLMFTLTCITALYFIYINKNNNDEDVIYNLGYNRIKSLDGVINDSFNLNVGLKYKQLDSLLLLNIEIQNALNTPSLVYFLYDRDSFLLFSFIANDPIFDNRYIASYLDNGVKNSFPAVKSIIQEGKRIVMLSYTFPLSKNRIDKIKSFRVEQYK
ncbi:MAG: hypothetical protein RLZZ546_2581 [Bacteroidota bacterium]|jgi:hypothetical protein